MSQITNQTTLLVCSRMWYVFFFIQMEKRVNIVASLVPAENQVFSIKRRHITKQEFTRLLGFYLPDANNNQHKLAQILLNIEAVVLKQSHLILKEGHNLVSTFQIIWLQSTSYKKHKLDQTLLIIEILIILRRHMSESELTRALGFYLPDKKIVNTYTARS